MKWRFWRGNTDDVHNPLLPLAPEFRPEDHQYYVDMVQAALNQGAPIRNIALTGGYGVGKSSVLGQVAKLYKKRVVEISLSTLGLADGDGGGEKSTTNRIQKEIVKQLLYREKPHKMRGSRFRRLARFGLWRSGAVALILGLSAWLTFFLAGWTAKLGSLLHADDLGLWFQLATFVALTGVALVLLAIAHNRVSIKGVKVANADIALASDETTYFDQFLDEIIYFFEVTKRDIVIFEDIDRFDDPHIFETLRALNTLLNASKQLSRDIRFVYAIKDSIFALLGNDGSRAAAPAGQGLGERSPLEVAPSNRTKFFDIVVPVVPFITHRNARELVASLMRDVDTTLSRDLLDLSAKRLPDMRLLKNVRNEFVVFREKVAVGGGKPLTADGLFAMMLYKNVYLEDFELVSAGKSQLDSLYAGSRRLVRAGVSALDQEAAELNRALSTLDSVGARSAELGQQLTDYAGRLARYIGLPVGVVPQVSFGGTTYSASLFTDVALWRQIAAANDSEILGLQFPGYGVQNGQFAISKADLAASLGDSLASAEWDLSDRDRIERKLDAIAADREFLLHANYVNLIRRRDLTSGDQDFSGLLDAHIGNGIGRELVEAGFIDQNFALYTSNYYTDRVSIQALNFLLHSVDRNEMDVDYALTDDDVIAILVERGDGILRERCAFNVSLLDSLLRRQDPRADELLEAMTGLNSDARSFWDAYLAGGREIETALARLANTWIDIFAFIAGRDDLSSERKTKYVDIALKNADIAVEYRVDDTLRIFVQEQEGRLEALTVETSDVRAAVTASLLSRAGVRIISLSNLTDPVRDAIVRANAYEVSGENLRSAVGDDELALDQLQSAHPEIYGYVIENLKSYLHALTGDGTVRYALVGSEDMPTVLAEVVAGDAEMVDAVIAQAGPSAQVTDLTSVPVEAWGALAERDRFPATFGNVQAYVASVGSVDVRLGGLLARAGGIGNYSDIDEPTRTALALRVLTARDAIPDPATRVDLVNGDGFLVNHLPVGQIQSEAGVLPALLLQHDIVEDNQEAFALVQGQGWETVGPFVARSKQFETYMSPSLLPINIIASLLRDGSIADSLKIRVLDAFDDYIPSNDPDALAAAAEFAVRTRRSLQQSQLLRISSANVDADLLADLLSISVTGMTAEEIRPIVEAIGGAIKNLLTRGGKKQKLKGTEANRAIVQRLKELDEVGSFKEARGEIEVDLKPVEVSGPERE